MTDTKQEMVLPTYRQLFQSRDFARLSVGSLLARSASQIWQIALVLFVLQTYHSPQLAGTAVFLSVAPGLVISPIVGALLDRHGRVRFILLDYSFAALSLFVLGMIVRVGALTPAILLVIAGLTSLTSPMSASGTRALFPIIVPRPLWDRANAVDSGIMALATVVGPALAGLLVGWTGGAGAFIATSICFVAAALAVAGLHEPHTSSSSDDSLLRSAWRALTYVLRHPTLRGAMLTLWMGNIGFGIITVALPVLVFTDFHAGAETVGILWSVSGVATAIAGAYVGRIDTEHRERLIVAIGMAIAALGTGVLLLPASVATLLASMILLGVSAAPIDIGLFSVRQRRTDPAWYGRAFAVSMSLNFAAMPIGSALGGQISAFSVALALGIAALAPVVGAVFAITTIPLRHDQQF